MPFSTYQIERLLDRLRRWRAFFHWPDTMDSAIDKVSLSPESTDREPPEKGAITRPSIKEVSESGDYPPAVERELERRAESFLKTKAKYQAEARAKKKAKKHAKAMESDVKDEAEEEAAPAIPPIPKTKRRTPRTPPQTLGEGD